MASAKKWTYLVLTKKGVLTEMWNSSDARVLAGRVSMTSGLSEQLMVENRPTRSIAL